MQEDRASPTNSSGPRPQKADDAATSSEAHQIVRYLAVGVFNTAISFVTYAVLVTAGLPYFISNLAGVAVSVAVGFALSRRFVFRESGPSWGRSAGRYVIVFISQYAVGTAAIGLLIEAGLGRIAAYVVALPVMVGISFVLQRTWVFGTRSG